MDESFYQDGPEEIKIVELIDDFPLRRDGVKNPAQKVAQVEESPSQIKAKARAKGQAFNEDELEELLKYMEYSSFTHSNKFNTINFSARSVNTVDGVKKFNQPENTGNGKHIDDIEEDIPEEIEDIYGNPY